MATGWETVEDGPDHDTCRTPDPGGWLYRHHTYPVGAGTNANPLFVSVVFVPDVRSFEKFSHGIPN